MKKIFTFLAVVVAFAVITTACSQDGDTVIDPPELANASHNPVSHMDTKVVSKADALDIAEAFNLNRFGKSLSRGSQSVESITNEYGQPIAYIVNTPNE